MVYGRIPHNDTLCRMSSSFGLEVLKELASIKINEAQRIHMTKQNNTGSETNGTFVCLVTPMPITVPKRLGCCPF